MTDRPLIPDNYPIEGYCFCPVCGSLMIGYQPGERCGDACDGGILRAAVISDVDGPTPGGRGRP